jgi:hypothetical protein
MPPKGYKNISINEKLLERITQQPDYGGSIAGYVEKILTERERTQYVMKATPTQAIAWIMNQVKEWEPDQAWELVESLLSFLRSSCEEQLTAASLLKRLLRGERPSEAEIIEICQAEDLPEQEIFEMCDRLFGGKDVNH